MDLVVLVAVVFAGYPIYFVVARLGARRHPETTPPSYTSAALYLLVVYFMVFYAIPNLLAFNGKAMQSEAVTNLKTIRAAQLKYHSTLGTYAGGPQAFAAINWAPKENRYAYFCGNDFIPNRKGRALGEEIWMELPVQPSSNTTGFTCLAIANIDQDPALDVWVVNDSSGASSSDLNLQDDLSPPQPLWKILVLAAMVGLLGVAAIKDEIDTRRRAKRRVGQGG